LPSWDDAALLADIYYTSDLADDFAMTRLVQSQAQPESPETSKESSTLLSRIYDSSYATLVHPIRLDDREGHEGMGSTGDETQAGPALGGDLSYHRHDAEASGSAGSIASASTERDFTLNGKSCLPLELEDDTDQNFKGYNALHLAAHHGQHSMVRLLLLKCLEPALYANTINDDGQSPLHMGAGEGQLEIVRELLGFGADVGLLDNKGQTALHAATAAGSLSVVHLLLDRDPNAKLMHMPDAAGQTPLHRAVTQGNEEIVRLLLDRGADAWSIVK
jgi:hypothetical protein